jgi:hypothetical protein
MKKLVLVLISVTAFLLMFTGTGICDNISNIQLSPSSPASLIFNQNVDITFDYTTEEAGGVRIFARPFSSGSLTSNYAAHSSPNYPVGSGSGTGYFTITSGAAIVDQIRIRMYNDDQSVLLLEFFIPVEYHFGIMTDVDLPSTSLIDPKTYFLYQNYPNPFNPTTMINYQLPMTSAVELSIYNLLGQRVATLVNERKRAGHHQVEWDASGFASGIYLYRLSVGSLTTKSGHSVAGEAEGFVETRIMVLMR